jgi:hypothetical protein
MTEEESNDIVSVRWPELIVALVLAGIAVGVIVDSTRVGIGWADDGPQSGYFPFYIGVAMLVSSLWVAIGQLRAWHRSKEVFAERSQLASVWTIAWPMTLYVALIAWLGIYLSSVVLIGWFMLRHGKHHPAVTAVVALGVPLTFFVVFERWFLVPLPKGPVEAMLGM